MFEDEHMLAVDKPAGLQVTSDLDQSEGPDLLTLAHESIQAGKPWAAERQLSFFMNASRLDAEISGVLLFAKSKDILARLGDLFGSEKPISKYVTLVRGQPPREQWEVNARLAPDPLRPGRLRVDSKNGKRARTIFSIREKFTRWTLLQCEPLTHRPQQIRAHLGSTGFPILGDSGYGGKMLLLSTIKRDYRLKPDHEERPLLSQPTLHCETLAFDHPITGGSIEIAAPWPKELKVAVKYLRRYASAGALANDPVED